MSPKRRKYSDSELIEILQKREKELGRTPTYRDFEKTKDPHPIMITRRFGTWNSAILKAKLPINTTNRLRYSKEKLIEMLKKDYEKLGRTPFLKELSYQSSLKRHFGKYSNAVKEAGLPPSLSYNIDSLDGILKAYITRIAKTRSDETVLRYATVLLDLESYLKSLNLEWKDIDYEVLINYFDILKTKGAFNPSSRFSKRIKPNRPRTLKVKFIAIFTFLKWTLRHSKKKRIDPIIDEATILDIEDEVPYTLGYEEYDTSRRALSEEEVFQIKEQLADDVYYGLIFDINVNLGLRISEISKMLVSDIKKENDLTYVVIRGKGKGKSDKLRNVVLTETQESLFEKMLAYRELNDVRHEYVFFTEARKKPTTKTFLTLMYQKMSEKCGIKFTTHDLRYTMVSFLEDAGIVEKIIIQRLGHAGKDFTKRYGRKKMIEQKRILEEKIPYI